MYKLESSALPRTRRAWPRGWRAGWRPAAGASRPRSASWVWLYYKVWVSLPTDSAERELKQTDDAQDYRAVLYQLSSLLLTFPTHSWYLWHSAEYRSLKEEENRYTWHLYFPGPLSLVNKQVNCIVMIEKLVPSEDVVQRSIVFIVCSRRIV